MPSVILKYYEVNLGPLPSWFEDVHWEMIVSNFEEVSVWVTKNICFQIFQR